MPANRIVRVLISALLLACACSNHAASTADPRGEYGRALAATALPTLELGSVEERKAVQRFIEFYQEFSADRIHDQVRGLYAENAYFRDPFREVVGIDAVERYFIATTEAIEDSTFDIQDWAQHDGNYYFRWVMSMRLRRYPDDPPIRAVGMSHIRFDSRGKVVFHQDYWDAAGAVYERLPVIGWVLRKIRGRM